MLAELIAAAYLPALAVERISARVAHIHDLRGTAVRIKLSYAVVFGFMTGIISYPAAPEQTLRAWVKFGKLRV